MSIPRQLHRKKGTVNRAFPQNGPVSRIMRLQDRNLAAKERNTKGPSTQDQKSTAPSNSLSKLLPHVENGNEYTTSSAQLQSHGFLITSNPSQGPAVDANQRDKTGKWGLHCTVPDRVMAAQNGDHSRSGRSMG